jgi:benzoyl-CoA reductase/2-hydroxyglutaryl-CoA dehydratase subunit BcrC/BadD/HgdB
VGLCAGAEIGFAEAERYVPRNTCALIKSFFGFALAKVCPYVEACDVIIGETTCDGKKKAYEIFTDMKPVYVMEIPHRKEGIDRELWRSELMRLKAFLEQTAGATMDVQSLRRGIDLVNTKRNAVLRMMNLRKASPAPISGKDALLINQVAFYDDPVRFAEHINAIADELEDRVRKGIGAVPENAPRIIVSGCPMAVPNWKLHHLVETSGAVVVGEESCVGMRNIRNLTSTEGSTVEQLVENILDRYMKIDCACFTPNDERLEHIVEMARELKAQGVIHYSLQFCTPYMMESSRVQSRLRQEGIPMLAVETDYSMEDAGQLGTRVQAFLEILH